MCLRVFESVCVFICVYAFCACNMRAKWRSYLVICTVHVDICVA